MALLTFLRRSPNATPASPAGLAPEAALQQVRIQSRRRLIGAAVLLALGVLGFPLVFQTQPRPLPTDLPLTQGQGQGQVTQAPAVPAVPAPLATAQQKSTPPASPPAVAREPLAEAPAPVGVAAPAVEKETLVESRTAPSAAAAAAPAAAPAPSAPADSKDKDKPRFVVQAGAYTDPNSLREARAKLERAGLKTYTQVVEVDGSPRTRVRVGPFATRAEAQEVLNKVKATGLSASVLLL